MFRIKPLKTGVKPLGTFQSLGSTSVAKVGGAKVEITRGPLGGMTSTTTTTGPFGFRKKTVTKKF